MRFQESTLWSPLNGADPVASCDDHRDERECKQIIGSSSALKVALADVECVAPTDSTVLVLGETGTGKELIARAIHNLSSRCRRPFVKLNCAAIPFDLLESELFGHEKGAFTGAIAQKIGRFEMADKGTLFLDEVGDIPLLLQPKLLRVLQEREFERLGSGRTQRVDVRVVAATHQDLEQMVKGSKFRSDLYYRLNVFPVSLPPLRARQEDIPKLITHFVGFYGRQIGKRIEHIEEDTMAALLSYPWPGNVRELQNLIERAVILSCDGVLPNPLPSNHRETATVVSHWTTLKEVDRALILQALEGADWIIGGPRGAAVKLGLKRTTLISRLKKLGIVRPIRGRRTRTPLEVLDHVELKAATIDHAAPCVSPKFKTSRKWPHATVDNFVAAKVPCFDTFQQTSTRRPQTVQPESLRIKGIP
jgi:formate hydrogenlyase transcriptional activator